MTGTPKAADAAHDDRIILFFGAALQAREIVA